MKYKKEQKNKESGGAISSTSSAPGTPLNSSATSQANQTRTASTPEVASSPLISPKSEKSSSNEAGSDDHDSEIGNMEDKQPRSPVTLPVQRPAPQPQRHYQTQHHMASVPHYYANYHPQSQYIPTHCNEIAPPVAPPTIGITHAQLSDNGGLCMDGYHAQGYNGFNKLPHI